jgi:hypothetical protein
MHNVKMILQINYATQNSASQTIFAPGTLLASKPIGPNPPKSKGHKYNKKFWKELICLLSFHYLKMSFALKPAFSQT